MTGLRLVGDDRGLLSRWVGDAVMISLPSLFVHCDGCRIYLIYSKPGPLFSESGRKMGPQRSLPAPLRLSRHGAAAGIVSAARRSVMTRPGADTLTL